MNALEDHQHGQDEVDDQENDSHIDGNGEDRQIDLNEQEQQQGNGENGREDGEGDVCVDMTEEGAAQDDNSSSEISSRISLESSLDFPRN